MQCPKCEGLMSYEEFRDSSRSDRFYGWRCIPCGIILDALILKNKVRKPSEIKMRELKWARKPKKK